MELSAIITFENVGVTFGEEWIYDRLSFDVRRGEFVCILGPSGCGKSTSLRIIGGLLDVSSGRVTVDGRAPQDAWSDIAFVFQSPRLVPWRTALDNVLLGSQLRFGGGDRERRKRCRAVVIEAKDHAKLAMHRAKSEELRAKKQEMVQWMLVWLENPGIFNDWVSLRVANM